MVLERTQDSVAVEEVPACRHHWVIEPANGRYSRGNAATATRCAPLRTPSTAAAATTNS